MACHKRSRYIRLTDPHCALALFQAPWCTTALRASGYYINFFILLASTYPYCLHLSTGDALYYNAGEPFQISRLLHITTIILGK